MEREILFKYVIKNKHTGVIYNKVYSLNQIEENGLKSLFDIENYEIIATLQFPGLTDKNGNRIFEGDIIKAHTSNYTVVFENGMFTTSIGMHLLNGEFEVIGNIFL